MTGSQGLSSQRECLMAFLPVTSAQSQAPGTYKYQEKFYFCRDLLKRKKKIPQSSAPLTEDVPRARIRPSCSWDWRRPGCSPALSLGLGVCLLLPPGGLWDQ